MATEKAGDGDDDDDDDDDENGMIGLWLIGRDNQHYNWQSSPNKLRSSKARSSTFDTKAGRYSVPGEMLEKSEGKEERKKKKKKKETVPSLYLKA
ncbi:unnamed protein product [Taenia asiatica]|uniref:Uncharacterized protein n=1 Tax=Taenia asiatica TaxID=60517 RepID=A0A0R3W331_TAEAS|nr:unnamed protein product [Taenia asiatica]